MKKRIIAGNWKMNQTKDTAYAMLRGLADFCASNDIPSDVEMVVCPPYPYLSLAVDTLKDSPVKVGAQNCSHESNGAFTGEVSSAMLADLGVSHVILGHSERRKYFKESDSLVLKKTRKAMSAGLQVILCVGEELAVREDEGQYLFVKNQLKDSAFLLSSANLKNLIVAYEPIWAIGTGKTATPEQANEMHYYIRDQFAENFDQPSANELSILYGGSCKPANAADLFAQVNVDGGLIGGASLTAENFTGIIDKTFPA